jgi:hypothetical protein
MKGAPIMKTLRNVMPLLALAALAATGCFLISGQFVVHYALPTPLHVTSAVTLTGVDVDLNTIGDYNDHKADLKRVDDLALIGDFKNNGGSTASVEAWIVKSAALGLSASQLSSQGVKLWGPLSVAAGATEKVDWNRSATLFGGRQALIDEIKGDGHFSLYIIASGTFDLTLTSGAVIAVVSAAK